MAAEDESPAGVHSHSKHAGGTVSVCLAGHLVPAPGPDAAMGAEPLCPQCSAGIIAACPGCREPILGVPASARPGSGLSDLLPGTQPVLPPRYCHCCGRPFPWTERVVSAVRMAIRQLGALDAFERDQLRRSVDHIIHETPHTRLALVRIHAALARIGGETAEQLRELLMSVASEGVRQQLAATRAATNQEPTS